MVPVSSNQNLRNSDCYILPSLHDLCYSSLATRCFLITAAAMIVSSMPFHRDTGSCIVSHIIKTSGLALDMCICAELEDNRMHPARSAPRCLPCNYTDPLQDEPTNNEFEAPRVCAACTFALQPGKQACVHHDIAHTRCMQCECSTLVSLVCE